MLEAEANNKLLELKLAEAEEANTKVEAELARLRLQLAEAEEANERAKLEAKANNELSGLQLAEAEEANTKVEAELARLRLQLEEAKEANARANLQAQHKLEIESIASKQTILTEEENERANLQAQHKLEIENIALKIKLTAAEQEKKALEASNEKASIVQEEVFKRAQINQSHIKALQDSLAKGEKDKAALNIQILKIQKDLKNGELERQGLSKQLKEANARIALLSREKEDITSKLNDALKQLKEKESKQKNLQKQNKDLLEMHEQLNELEKYHDITTLKKRVQNLIKNNLETILNLKIQIDGLKQDIARANAETKNTMSALTEATRNITRLENQVMALQARKGIGSNEINRNNLLTPNTNRANNEPKTEALKTRNRSHSEDTLSRLPKVATELFPGPPSSRRSSSSDTSKNTRTERFKRSETIIGSVSPPVTPTNPTGGGIPRGR